MKRLIGVAAGLAMVAGLAQGQTNVLSQNAVGYVKINMDAGKFYLVSTQWLQIDGSPNTVNNVLGTQFADFSQAFTWNGSSFNASHTLLPGGTGNWTGGATAIEPGDGFWLTTGTSVEAFFLGEVPGANNGFDMNVVSGVTGFQILSNPYPVNIAWQSTDLADQLTDFSQLFQFDPDTGFLPSVTKLPGGNWTSNPTISVGEGFWVRVGLGTGSIDWTETKPYTYP